MQNDTDVSPNRASHKLIDDQSYASTYLRIKYNWAHQVAQNWNERSDPQKVVYEDCGIASYLLELWNKYEILPNKFADLGCGNGLLVYLLAKENANGVGVDVRKRKIWEQLADSAQLYEVAIDPTSPSTSTVLNEVDFLIGNHSDELTPWIPVMAARRKCNFFLLPCCAFDFFSKFSRTSRRGITGVGVPDTYHNFIRSVIQKLGFDLKEDQLKIPSRKTKCFIGTIPGDGLPENVEEIIEELLSVARQIKSTFSARPAIQQLRNCSAISHDFRLATTKKFFDYLLALEDTENKDLRQWRCGSSVPLLELANLLSEQEKQMMKNQDGGMKTFLKNQHQVFLTRSGRVEIRHWPVVYKEFLLKPNIKDNFQKSQCWFYFNHPDGCPVDDSVCPFSHASGSKLL